MQACGAWLPREKRLPLPPMKRQWIRRLGFGLLLGVYLAGSTPLSELFKLPALVSHFIEHRRADPSISIVHFIVLHYFSGNIHDADHDRDMQLPFKSVDYAPLTLAIAQPGPEPVIQTPASAPFCRKCLPPWALLFPPTPYVAMPSEPPEA